jgi:peptidylprolyl isomerase
MMMHRIARSALLVVVLIALVAFGVARSYAQAPAQAPAAAAAAVPPPPAPADVAAVPADAEKTASGLAWKVLKPGTGKVNPTSTDQVTVNYNGWTTNGRIFDSTDVRRKPSVFVVANVLPGMGEGIKLMTVGEKRRFWMPAEIAFNNAPGKPQGMCVFEIELLAIQPGPPPELSTAAPPDVKAPPADAQKTGSGLASKVLRAGTGKDHPKATSTVTVKYVGWTPDGQMFDASALHGGTASFPLNAVIAGWTEGVQLMVEGEQRRFWIPGKLAYDNVDREGAPKGMLVFDIELVKIQ